MAILIPTPPHMSHPNSSAASARGLAPAARMADNLVPRPNAAIAIRQHQRVDPDRRVDEGSRQQIQGIEGCHGDEAEGKPRNGNPARYAGAAGAR